MTRQLLQRLRTATLLACFCSAVGQEILPPGHRPIPTGLHALVGARVYLNPSNALESATVIIRNGLIESAGKDVAVPPGARVWAMEGSTIYPGLIDCFLTLKPAEPAPTPPQNESGLTAGVNFYGVPGSDREKGTASPGYEVPAMVPERRAAITFKPDPKTIESFRELGFTAGNVIPDRGIMRGTSAFVLLSDSDPNEAILRSDVFQHVALDANSGKDGVYPRSLMGTIAAVRQGFFDAQHYILDQADFEHRPDSRRRPPFNPALEALRPAVERKMPVVLEAPSVLLVDRAGYLARELKLDYILLSGGQEWRRMDLAKSASTRFMVPLNFPEVPKLPEEDDWSAVSLDQLRAWDWAPENPALLRRQGAEIALTTHGLADRKTFRKNLRLAVDRGLSEADALAALTTVPAHFCGVDRQLGSIEPGKIANLTIVKGSLFNPEDKATDIWIEGRNYPLPMPVVSRPRTNNAADKIIAAERDRTARSPMENRGAITYAPVVFVKNATIWTCASPGRLERASLLVENGKITAVGTDLKAPSQALLIDGTDKHVTPGLIDCHNHSMILGAVNESSLPSTAMVRVGDVVNSETRRIQEQLAGGLTVANLLHGSANPVGGQNCVIKLREGAGPEDLKFAQAPAGIKFALGENVKQSNWGDKNVTRFPQTRMGVRTLMANRFTAAQKYLQDWETFKHDGGVPPRRNLELEAIGEIIQGQRLIHCHSYRQDEILAFLRLMESFNVKVGTLQHVLEGYKVADEIATHGAGASCFSDWWAYKFEVYDAIPYAGSLMRQRGVNVSFNSDSSDLARRLYLEAAKAVKYGGTSEEEALKFVTINPAAQLHIEKWVGSLEPGKDADFVLWSRSPLDSGTVCLETWIDGKKYFDRAVALDRANLLDKERENLLARARKFANRAGTESASEGAKGAFFRAALEYQYDQIERHCDEEN